MPLDTQVDTCAFTIGSSVEEDSGTLSFVPISLSCPSSCNFSKQSASSTAATNLASSALSVSLPQISSKVVLKYIHVMNSLYQIFYQSSDLSLKINNCISHVQRRRTFSNFPRPSTNTGCTYNFGRTSGAIRVR